MIMMNLFDEEQIMKSFIKSEHYEAAQDKVKKVNSYVTKRGNFYRWNTYIFLELSNEEIEEVKDAVMQLA